MKINKEEIDKEKMIDIFELEFKNAEGFPWTGWRIPIFYHDDGRISSGSWVNGSIIMEDAIEIYGVEPWVLENQIETKDLDENERQEILSDIVRNMVEFAIDQVYENIDFHNEQILQWELMSEHSNQQI